MKSSYSTSVQDWMSAIRRPTPYRVGSTRLYVRPRTLAYAFLFSFAVVILVTSFIQSQHRSSLDCLKRWESYYPDVHSSSYDYTYPLTPPISIGNGMQFRIALVADLDTDSKSAEKKNTWFSYLHEGNLTISQIHNYVDVHLDSKPHVLKSTLSQGGRGMELSELIVFDGKLFTVDDRTGVIYHISNRQVFPWVLLADGDGDSPKGFKCEWATVKKNRMYVGGLGKEWTSIDGVVENLNPQFVKSIGVHGDVKHLDWHEKYNAMRERAGYKFPGYVIHEAGVWSEVHQRWFFLPRRASALKYEEKADERRATNILIITNDDFSDIQVKHIGLKHPTRGYSSFKFVPNTNDEIIVALKSEEDSGNIASYISAFSIDGKVLLKERRIGAVKYEGIEFI